MTRERVRLVMRDADLEVRLHGARAAIALGLDRAGDEVVAWLQEAEPRLRATACEVIEASPTPESVAALARVLSDSKADVREAAARAMGASGQVETIAALLGRLDDPAVGVRRAVVRALGRLGDARAAVPLVGKLQDTEPEVRAETAKVLGQLGDPRSVSSLELALQDKEPSVRIAVLDALGRLGLATSVRTIAELLRPDGALSATGATGFAMTRQTAIAALAKIESPEALRLLASLLAEEGPVPYSEDAVAHVRRAFGAVGLRAEATLREVVETSREVPAASAAAMALALVVDASTAPAAVASIARSARRGDLELASALAAMERIGAPSALPFVLEHVTHADVTVRERAVAVATKLLEPSRPDGRVIDIVRERVLDPKSRLGERVALARLLGRTGSPRAAAVLLALLPRVESTAFAGGPVPLDVAALLGLGELGESNPDVEARLLEYLGHPSERVRTSAATALARVGRDAAATRLLSRLRDSAEQDRSALALALSGALARSSDAALVGRTADALKVLSGHVRDALIEGLGRSSLSGATALLGALARHEDVDERRKIAEAIVERADAVELGLTLAMDADPGVRASAAWALGSIVDASRLDGLRALTRDQDVAVAANAAGALAVAARRLSLGTTEGPRLCALLEDTRSYVASQALVGLRLLEAPCAAGVLRRLVLGARSPRVREAAALALAMTLARGATSESKLDALALARCADEERDAAAARACTEGRASSGARTPPVVLRDVLVYVVPGSGDRPEPRAPFAVVLPGGMMRLGVTDRRGAVFLRGVADGTVELAVPAALAP